MRIFVGNDYRGFKRKQEILQFLASEECIVSDLGSYDENENDYNDAAIMVAKQVRENPGSLGILICDSAHGMTIQANRFKGIRAANCHDETDAKLAREHEDANVLCLSAREVNTKESEKIVQSFLSTKFEPLERRVRRINRLDEREDYD